MKNYEKTYALTVKHIFGICLMFQVEMGPFKHTVDDGLDVRKAAFECMYTLLDNCLECLDIFEFLNHVEEGLKDHYDIRVSKPIIHIMIPCNSLFYLFLII